jgi:hypothetical protein
MAKSSRLRSKKEKIAVLIITLCALAIGFAGGFYYHRNPSSSGSTTPSTTVPVTVCNCPAILSGEDTKAGPPPCHCPEAE